MFNFTWQGSLIHFSPAQRALDGDRAKPDCHGTTLVSASPIKTLEIWTPLASIEIVRRYVCRSMPGCEPNTQGREVFLLFICYLRECIRSKNTFQHGWEAVTLQRRETLSDRALKDGACVQFCRLFIATIITKLSTCSTHSSETNREPYHVGFAEFRVMSEKEIATFVDTIGKKLLWSWSYTGVHSK